MTTGRTIRLFLEDGRLNGIISAEVMNWTGCVTRARREDLDRLVDRSEIKERPGVYFLIGPPRKILPRIYIGETENMSKRLLTHRATDKKSFWEDTVIITSKDSNLTKSHVRYLEWKMREMVAAASKADLVSTKKDGEKTVLSNSDRSDMSYFIDQAEMVLLALGIPFLVQDDVGTASPSSHASPETEPPASPQESPQFVLLEKRKELAYAAYVDGKFTVLKDSRGRIDAPDSFNHYRPQRETLKERGIIRPETGGVVFTQNAVFSSPSAASSVIKDRNDNGRTSWLLENDRKTTFGMWDAGRYQVPGPAGVDQEDEIENIEDDDGFEGIVEDAD